MKIIIFLFALSVVFSACDNNNDCIELRSQLQAKRADAAAFVKQLEAFDLDSEAAISEQQTVDDELMMVAIEIAVLESYIEDCSFR